MPGWGSTGTLLVRRRRGLRRLRTIVLAALLAVSVLLPAAGSASADWWPLGQQAVERPHR